MTINPTAILFWAMGTSAGYLIGDFRGAVMGFLIAASVSVAISVVDAIVK